MIFSVILAVAILYASIARRRREEKRQQAIEQSTTHAFLVSATNENRRYRIDHTPWRIGRSRNTELPLEDTSVSRLHGEIRRDALGQFTIQDLDSLNGVFVNGQPIEMAHLDEGDRVEIGDVAFIFTFHDEDYARQEPTVLVRTITPT
jgi:pSer/pThr/pTyr-binding forkhead associated (FHA) protein